MQQIVNELSALAWRLRPQPHEVRPQLSSPCTALVDMRVTVQTSARPKQEEPDSDASAAD
jgi:hypothetical protein